MATRISEAPIPAYERVKRFILREIESGRLKPNDQIPTEKSLRAKFDVSRMTVHRAVTELKDAGVVNRVPGLGSFVSETLPKTQLIKVSNIAEEVRGRGHDYRAHVVQNKKEKADAEIASLMGIAEGKPVYRSIIVHHENDSPIQLEDRYVSPDAAPDYTKLDLTQVTPFEYLQALAPLHRVEHRVKAIMPDKDTRKLLKIAAGEPCLLLIRRTWSFNKVITWGRYTHPGNRFEFADTFET